MFKFYRKYFCLLTLLSGISTIAFFQLGASAHDLSKNERFRPTPIQTVKDDSLLSKKSFFPVGETMIGNLLQDTSAAFPAFNNSTDVPTNPLANEVAKILPPNGENGFGRFGSSVAVSGNTLVIGAPRENVGTTGDEGAAYVYVRNGNSWEFQQRIYDPNPAYFSNFGVSVAIDGDSIIVGANNVTVGQNPSQGAAFVFVRNGTVWSFQQKLFSATGAMSDWFGYSVAIKGDTAIVGAHMYEVGANTNQGAAFVFQRTGGVWSEHQKLVAADGTPNAYFGWSVALSGDTAIFGATLDNNARGAAYIFTRTANVWSQQAKLTANDANQLDNVGYSVALEADTAVVGSRLGDGLNENQGAAYIFTRTGNVWSQQTKLLAPDGVLGDGFGISAAISDNALVIGASGHNPGGSVRVGAAFLFLKVGNNWIQRAELIESDYATSLADGFGGSVAIAGDNIFAGAPFHNFGVPVYRGAVYYYRTPTFAPDLQSAYDSGVSNTDNITKNQQLTFDIDGVTPGATVDLLRNNVVVASGTAIGTTITLTDAGLPADGNFSFSARETRSGVTSSPSDAVVVKVDNTAPTVTINQAAAQVDPTRLQPINFTATFNEPVVGFGPSDISLGASTADVSSAIIGVSGSVSVYNVSVGNITADGIVSANVLPNSVEDAAGNIGTAASTSTDNNVTFDTTGASVTINQAAGQQDPTRNLPINFTVVFNEPVTGFFSDDVILSGVDSATTTVTGSGTTYNVEVNYFLSDGNAITATIRAQAADDAAGNASVASTSTDNTIIVDNFSPRVTINQAAGQADPTNVLPINYTVVFSEPVTGFDSASDISFSGGVNVSQAVVNITGSGATYNVAVSGNIVSNGGTLRVQVQNSAAQDALGNNSLASTSTDNGVTLDNVPPNVTINQAVAQQDPTSVQPVNFRVVFSEIVTGFTAADVSLSGSTANVSFAAINVAGSGNTYTVSVSNIRSSGQVRASIIAGAAIDAVGNLSNASTSTDNTVAVNVPKRAPYDFDGDNKTDIGIWRASTGSWWYLQSSDLSGHGFSFGLSNDIITPGDFTGDGKTDLAIWRPSTGEWYVQRSEDGSYFSYQFGLPGDIPAPADYDGDGITDTATFRPSTQTWYIFQSATGTYGIVTFGLDGDSPVPADFDGDGKADIAVWRPSNGSWWIVRSSDLQARGYGFGTGTDKPVVGDYTGDGKAEIALWRDSTREWFFLRSEGDFTSYYSYPSGLPGDLPAPGDYDGDGKFDSAVFRPSTQTWYIDGTSAGSMIATFGLGGDRPVPNAFVP